VLLDIVVQFAWFQGLLNAVRLLALDLNPMLVKLEVQRFRLLIWL
jgi:hypothetical protein